MEKSGIYSTRPKLRGPQPQGDYEVGYCKPPAKTRFAKGVSGNPKGRVQAAAERPSLLGEERLKTIISAEAYRRVRIADNGRTTTLEVAEAIVRAIAAAAIAGDKRSQRLFTDMLARTEREDCALHDEWITAAITYKREWTEELERRKSLGIRGPMPVPHPDHIVINSDTCCVEVHGPESKEQKAKWNRLRKMKAHCLELIERYEEILSMKPEEDFAEELHAYIRHETETVKKIDAIVKY